ncbi:MAG: peptide deformylase [Candidatus Omnitrophica bacterium]|nr:peptide deformylase [Candidatus Omnitrophota bacterium]
MQKTELKIRLLGDPGLRKKAHRILDITAQHRAILSQMAELMYKRSGVGLAAPQVGIDEQMIVVDIGEGLYKLINPRIIKRQGKQIIPEGCLSIPGITINVKRAKKIFLMAQDEYGKPLEIEAEDLLACVFQHEIDHLRGILIVDYASFFERLSLKKKIEEIKNKAKAKAETKEVISYNNQKKEGVF